MGSRLFAALARAAGTRFKASAGGQRRRLSVNPVSRGDYIMPLISVVIPTHNRPDMLAEALDSVNAQTFVDYEIVVVSNGEDPQTRSESRGIASLRGARYFALSDGSV